MRKRQIQFPFKIVFTKSEEGVSVHCSDLPGCWSQGRTEKEALHNIKAAIHDYLSALSDIRKKKKVLISA
ncbi:MAG: type II toxin-antitoxin system HicB family antitoxin [Candidatus Aureabacteria bacterium]|nr:type II toxin-antitoxin system HicB family antitoxin [Candidatus Auribacterota bacterium]